MMRPAEGRRVPLSRRSSVVLPAPDGPMIASTSPRCTAKVTPLIARAPVRAAGWRTLRFVTEKCGNSGDNGYFNKPAFSAAALMPL